ncbi:MAG: hypothetical protein QOD43_871 [Gaiellaceae bacterium]|nr:hypothetical protein [Gaiellaceae bacterium]
MRRLLVFFGTISVLLAAGCGGGGGKASAPREQRVARLPSAEEIAWFRQMAAFANAVTNLSEQAAGTGGAKALAALRDCGPIFRSSVGPAPTGRQRAAAQVVLGACSAFRRGDLAAGDRALSVSGARIFLRSDGRSLPRRGGVTEVSRVEPRFSRVVAALSGVPATVVRCWSLPDWIELIAERGAYTGGAVDLRADGFVSEGTRVNLAPRMCERLVRFVYEGRRPGRGKVKLQLANTVLTLGHETVHVAPGGDEAVATCYGLQRMRRAGVLLGAPRAYAESLAELAWSGLYPFGLAKYHSPECKNGGKLDLNPRIPRWP